MPNKHLTLSRPLVIAAVMASMAMVAIEATIVATAMPQIVTGLLMAIVCTRHLPVIGLTLRDQIA